MLQKKKTPVSPNKWGYQSRQRHVNKKLPPYGRRLLTHLQAGKPIHNDIFIFIGGTEADRRAKSFWYGGNVALAYHPFHKPDEYCWPVMGNDVLIFDLLSSKISAQQMKKISLELLNAGALVVRYITPDHNIIQFKGDGYANPITH